LLTVSLLGLIVYVINPAWMRWSTIPLPDWLRWIGAMLGTIGAILLVWTHRVLGKNFFGGMKIRADHQLIEEGPYRRVRHPMYTAFILLGLGFFFLSGNWLIGGTWLLATGLVIATRMPQEEQMMAEQFGEKYEAYQARTVRFLPKF
jgi:protein-S-isoprenylcysteine O-methyltransferase Ste14